MCIFLYGKMQERFYSFNCYLREKFGERVHRISIDAGFSCPNIDGTKSKEGCIYCNNKAFSRFSREKISIEEQIVRSIQFYSEKMKVKKFIAYFQAFTNTYADVETLKKTYDVIKRFPQIVGIFISTRPDCVDEEKIRMISRYKDKYLVWMEYGLQTTHDRILEIINRNHTYKDFLTAFNLSKKYGLEVGAHIILGLPTQTYEEMMEDAYRLAQLKIDGIKFHVLHVLKDTLLEREYQEGKISLLTQQDYVNLVCDFLERLPKRCVILRLVSTADPKYLIGPCWINERGKVIEAIKKELERRGSFQGYFYESASNTSK